MQNGLMQMKLEKLLDDWDFSEEGRKRQAKRMADKAEKHKQEGNHVVADFVCPTPAARELFNADYVCLGGHYKRRKVC